MSQERLDAQHWKEAGGGASALKQNRRATIFQSEVAVFGSGDLLKSAAAPRKLLEPVGGHKQPLGPIGGFRIKHRNQACGVTEGQGSQYYCVDETKDRRVRANPQREGQYGHYSEARRFA